MPGRATHSLPKTSELLDQARGTVFPDYALGVWLKGKTHFAYAGCGANSLFDLASVSKVLSTTTLAALAHEKGVVPIDRQVKYFFHSFPDPRVLVSHLLNHTGGLPAWLALHTHFHAEQGRGEFDARRTPPLARARYEREILASWLPGQFEKEAVYSDLGFMLLGWALEKSSDLPLDALFQEWIVKPTGLESLQYLPTSPDVVPTEDCPWRGHVLRGEVHDDNTYVLGGVAGHAGLFGNTRDVLQLGLHWLDAFQGRPTPIPALTTAVARRFWTFSHLPKSSRVLGWDGVTAGASSTGKYFHPSSRGHLGYTGTSLWIDPQKELIVTLLTNRVHPTRTNEKIKEFRPIFHDTLLTELGVARI